MAAKNMLDMQTRSMRDNLMGFFNIQEPTLQQDQTEDCVNTVKSSCTDKLKLEGADDIKMDRAHRAFKGGYPVY